MQDQIIDSPNDVSDASERRMREALELMSRPKSQDVAAPRQTQPSFGGPRPNSPKPVQQKGPPQKMPDGARPRRRFAQDGDVPVVLVGRSRDADPGADSKLAGMESSLANERNLRLRAERNVAAAQGLIQSLKTQVAHAELTIQEMRNAERQLRADLEAAQQALAEARLAVTLATTAAKTAAVPVPAPVVAPAPVPADIPIVAEAIDTPATESDATTDATDLFGAPAPVAAAIPARRGRKPKAAHVAPTADEGGGEDVGAPKAEGEQPIEWWLPSFRVKKPLRRRKGS